MRFKRLKPMELLGRLTLLVFFVITMFPIYWMLITSFKPQSETFRLVPTFFPERFTLDAYTRLFTKTSFVKTLMNSIIISLTVSTLTITLGFPCAYALARLRFRGRNMVSQGILITYLMPAAVLFIPFYTLLAKVGLTNNLWGLILIYPTKTLPYAVWILTPFISTVPKELDEAAMVDGCTRMGALLKVVMPLAAPSIAATFIFSITMCWGEYLYALVCMTKEAYETIPLFISGLSWADITPWAQVMASGILVSLPIVLLYSFASNFLVGGLTAGGIKM